MDWEKLGRYGNALFDTLLASIGFALAGINILGVTPFAFLKGWATNLANQAVAALSAAQTAQTTANTAQTTATNVGTAVTAGATGTTTTTGDPAIDNISVAVGTLYTGVNQAAAQAAQAQAALSGYLAQQQAAAAGGNSASDTFHRANSVGLGPNYTAFAAGTGGGSLDVVSNVAHFDHGSVNSAETNMFFWGGVTYATDYQSAHLTVSSTFNLGLFVAATLQTSVWCWCRGDGVPPSGTPTANQLLPYNAIMGGFVSTGVVALAAVVNGVRTILGQYNHAQASGDTIEVRAGTLAGPRVYQLLLNGAVVISYTDNTLNTHYGTGYRQAGIMVGADTGVTTQALPPDIVQFDIADIVGGTGYVGYGWQIFRAATTTIEVDNGTTAPAGTFDTANTGPNVVINNLGTGAVVCPRTGWYLLTMSFFETAVSGLRQIILKGMVGGTVYGQTEVTVSYFKGSNGAAFTQDTQFSGSVLVYAVAGQIIQPAIGGNYHVTTAGDAGGTQTYFTGALIGTE